MLDARSQFENNLTTVCNDLRETKLRLQNGQPISIIDTKTCDQLLNDLQVGILILLLLMFWCSQIVPHTSASTWGSISSVSRYHLPTHVYTVYIIASITSLSSERRATSGYPNQWHHSQNHLSAPDPLRVRWARNPWPQRAHRRLPPCFSGVVWPCITGTWLFLLMSHLTGHNWCPSGELFQLNSRGKCITSHIV